MKKNVSNFQLQSALLEDLFPEVKEQVALEAKRVIRMHKQMNNGLGDLGLCVQDKILVDNEINKFYLELIYTLKGI